MLKRSDIRTLAKRTGAQVRKRQSNLLSERDQLKEYDQRIAKGVDGLKDILDKHGSKGLAAYTSAMESLKRKQSKP